MGVRVFVIAVACLTACTQSGPAPVLEGVIQDGTAVIPIYKEAAPAPIALGEMTGTIGPTAYVLKSYDYSVGAIDPAVWVQEMDGTRQMRATFERADDPRTLGPVLRIKAAPPAALAAGMRFPVNVELVQEDGRQNPVVLRTVVPAEIALTGFAEGGSGAYDRIAGMLTGPICTPSGAACTQMALQFATGVYQNDW
jgi:hypothetical protein